MKRLSYETMRKNAWDMAREFKSIAYWKWDNTNEKYPYKCSVCGYTSDQCFPHCPGCAREMLV